MERLIREGLSQLNGYRGGVITVDPRLCIDPPDEARSREKLLEHVSEVKRFYLATRLDPPQKSFVLAFPNVSSISRFHFANRCLDVNINIHIHLASVDSFCSFVFLSALPTASKIGRPTPRSIWRS